MKTHHHKSSALIGVLCGLILSFTLSVAQAANTYWVNTGTGAWEVDGNWSNGVPYSGYPNWMYGYIDNGGTAVIGDGVVVSDGVNVTIGGSQGSSGSLLINGNGYYGDTAFVYVGVNGTGYLTITDNGTLMVDELSLGEESTGTGTVVVSGSAYFKSNNSVWIGYRGHGTLQLIGNSQTSIQCGDYSVVGGYAGSYGNITLGGSASLELVTYDYGWDREGFIIGYSGTGELNLGQNNVVNITGHGDVSLGFNSTGVGYIEIDNTSELYVEGAMYVGKSGQGAITLNETGYLGNEARVVIGEQQGSDGLVELKDSSYWYVNNSVTVGSDGHGSVTLTADARIEGDGWDVVLGEGANGVGTVAVSGSAYWDTYGGNLIVGNYGSGTLTLTDGGSIYSSYVGVGENGIGTVTVSGSAHWDTDGSDFIVGNNGSGTVTLTDSGSIYSNYTSIGDSEGGVGTVTVSGSAHWDTDGNDFIVGNYGSGTLTLTDNGSISSGYGGVGDSEGSVGTVTISGSAHWDTDGSDFVVGYYGSGTLTLTESGSIHSGYVGVGRNENKVSTVTISGSAYWNVDGELVVGDDGIGILTLAENARIDSMYGTIGWNTDSVGSVTISGSAVWNIDDGNLVIGAYHSSGTLNLNGGTIQTTEVYMADYEDSTATLIIGGDGSGKIITASNAAADITSGDGNGIVRFNHTGDIEFANAISGANLNIEHDSGSTTLTADSSIKNLSVSGGILNIDTDVTLTGTATVSDGATLGGAGTLTGGPLTVEVGGRLVTTLTLTDGLTLETGAILDYEDRGLLIFGGTITVGDGILIDFSGLAGTGEYVVLDWGDTSGGDSIAASQFTLAAGTGVEGTFSVDNGQLTFNATAVPEPSTWFLIGAGLGALALIRRRSS
jgi:T5SS/PEP-CTERM-associated repeat protein